MTAKNMFQHSLLGALDALLVRLLCCHNLRTSVRNRLSTYDSRSCALMRLTNSRMDNGGDGTNPSCCRDKRYCRAIACRCRSRSAHSRWCSSSDDRRRSCSSCRADDDDVVARCCLHDRNSKARATDTNRQENTQRVSEKSTWKDVRLTPHHRKSNIDTSCTASLMIREQ
jgi:hypothetical protein